MATSIDAQTVHDVIIETLIETFERSGGAYLDDGTSLFETLAGINAEQASVGVGKGCATLAAQVDHTRFYIDVLMEYLDGTHRGPTDWDDIWTRVGAVTPAEWAAINQRLHASYQALRARVAQPEVWAAPDSIGRVMSILMHTAYHLGEIRQALCVLR
jgi:hypothetical protein